MVSEDIMPLLTEFSPAMPTSELPALDPVFEIRATLTTLRQQLDAQAQILDAAIERLDRIEAPRASAETPAAILSQAEQAASPPSAEDVAAIGAELRSMERLYSMLDAVELDTSMEAAGALLAGAEADLARMNDMAFEVRSEDLFDSLDALPLLDAPLLPRGRWLRRPKERHRLLGVLLPNERKPRERDDGFITRQYHETRIFLLAETGEIRTLMAKSEDMLGLLAAKGSLRLGALQAPLSRGAWELISHEGAGSLRPAEATDLVFSPRVPDSEKEHPDRKHLIGAHNQPRQSISAVIRERFEAGLAQALDARRSALQVRRQAVAQLRRTMAR
jgi:hypothetical protein